MKHVYTVNTKLIEGKTYYFVKKIMTVPELGETANLVTGYGMHTDFDKACKIAGIDDAAVKTDLLADLEQQNKLMESIPGSKKAVIEFADPVNKWLADIGVMVLN